MNIIQPRTPPERSHHLGRRRLRSLPDAFKDLMSATAGRRIDIRRVNRDRVVFVSRAARFDPADDLAWDAETSNSAVRGVVAKLAARQPFSPVGAIVVRPVADGLAALQVLRRL